MKTEENKKIKGLENLTDKGLALLVKTQNVIDVYDPNKAYGPFEADFSFDIVGEYHKWVNNTQQFMELNFEDKIMTSVFREAENIPTFDWLDEHQYYNGDYIPIQIPQDILKETKKKLEHIRNIAQVENKKEQFQGNIKEKNKFPYKLPAGTKWEDFFIKFLNDEEVFIQIKQFKHMANFEEMGFIGKGKDPNPSTVWIFFKVLAQVNGELTIKDPEAKDKYKKQKEFLARKLQGYFSIDYDPFFPYRSSSEKRGNSYKTKFNLFFSPTISNKVAKDENNNDTFGLQEYLDEQAPQM